MAILKCKMCGGELNVAEGITVAECEYCGTKQTLPKINDEVIQNLFNRANNLRIKCEFDKAAGVYESIVAEYPEEAEGYWGLVLCTYGIEYVDDSKTGKKIPTCHRTSITSVMDDSNFEMACENADVVAKSTYREEAKAIDKLQKQILSVVESEEPYDIFICYKETDDVTKNRTEDSQIAQDIYTELVQAGYKVFFSRVTLRDKAGNEYEPYIYAALSSAKVMLAIGTKFDYYDAVWVKNEWSRYLSMMASDSSKHLIPCFKNLDAYDIPKEFRNLQALDMGEVTFFKNLLSNIERLVPKAPPAKTSIAVEAPNNSATAPLLKRAFMFLDDGDWNSANEYCEKVLDLDPECAEAYLGKLMAEVHVATVEKLAYKHINASLENNPNYKKFIRFGNDELKLNFDRSVINWKYNIAVQKFRTAETVVEYSEVAKLFSDIAGYKDSDALRQKCLDAIESKKTKSKNENEQLISKRKRSTIAADGLYCYALRNDGTAIVFSHVIRGDIIPAKDAFSSFENVIYLDCSSRCSVIGVKKEGTVVTGGLGTTATFADVSSWNNIVAVAAGANHFVGLKNDGTVVAAGKNNQGQCNVADWEDIIAISAEVDCTVGLKKDGTVVTTREEWQDKVSQFCDIVEAMTDGFGVFGLKSDGTVVSSRASIDLSEWSDIVTIAACFEFIVGAKSDGTVVIKENRTDAAKGFDVTSWTEILALSVSRNYILGLRADGTIVVATKDANRKCDTSYIRDIDIPLCSDEFEKWNEIKEKLYQKRLEAERLKTAEEEAARKAAEEEAARKEAEKVRKKAEEEARAEYLKKKADRRANKVCQHCGGAFKGLFTKTCSNCGIKKDY